MEVNKIRIAVVDDEEIINAIVVGHLQLYPDKYEVFSFRNPIVAIDAIKSGDYDVVISDVSMPQISGLELIKELKEFDNSLQIIMISGYAHLESVVESMKLGAVGFITKPINFEMLRLEVDKAFEKRSLILRNKESQKRWDMLFNMAHDMVFIVDIDIEDRKSELVEVNSYACGRLGYLHDELLEVEPQSIINHSGSNDLYELIKEMKISSSVILETELFAKSGVLIPVEVNLRIILKENKYSILAIARDISNRKKAETELKMLGMAIEKLDEIIMITDPEGIIQYVNPSFTNVTQYQRDEIIGKSARFLKSGQMSGEFYSKMWNTISSGNVWKGHFVNKKKDRSFYEEEAIISPVKDDNGAITNYIALKRDVTEKLRMEAQLRQAQKIEAIGTLAAGIAHEINTPMQFIMDNTVFLEKSFTKLIAYSEDIGIEVDKLDSEECIKNVNALSVLKKKYKISYIKDEIPYSFEDMFDGIDRVRKIVLSMKDFAHPGVKEKAYASINKSIESTVTISRNVWKYRSDLEINMDESIPEVYCNIDDINQVVLNLIVNAIDAIKEFQEKYYDEKSFESNKGLITISTKQSGKYVVIEISDSGIGMDEKTLEKIFEPFYTTKEVGKGTGQGLAIVHDIIVNKHKGEIDVQSTPGEGTKFSLSILIEG